MEYQNNKIALLYFEKSTDNAILIRFSVLSHKAKQKTASYAGVVLKAYRKRYQTMI